MKYKLILFLLTLNVAANAQQRGMWRFVLQLNDSLELPFTAELNENALQIMNAEERISVDEISYENDSIYIKMPVFDSELRAQFTDSTMKGNFINHARKNKNVIPFYADYGLGFRFFDKPARTTQNFSGRWQVEFAGDEDESKISIGEFKQDGNRITGTFLTVTGDYRYLEGDVSGDQFFLSCFDGSHAFLFTAKIQKDGK